MSQNNPQKVKYPVYASTQQRVEQTVPHMLENQRRLSLIGHPDFGQAGYPQQYGFPQGLPTVPSNSAHDMSKQVPAGQPGMYPNSGGIPTASQQHHQPGMGAPAPSPQPPPMVQPGQQINRGHNMPMSNYYARTSAPRTMPSMARNPLTNVVNQTAQQPSSQYSQPVHMVPSHASFNQMPAVLLNHHLAHMYQQRPYSPPQYSIISPGPAAVYVNSWNNYSNPTPPNTNGYYPSTPISSFNTIPPPPVSNHMPAPATKLRKNAIPIINPDTGEDVLNRLNDDDSSRPQSEKEAENVGTNISIQFAAQVAAALANDQKNESLPKSAPVEDRRILDSQPPVLCPSEIEVLSNIEQVQNTELHEVCEPYIDNRNITCTDEPNIAFFKKDDSIIENTFENEKIIPETVESVQTTENQDSDTYSALPDATVNENIYETKTDNVPLHDVSESEKNVGYYGVQETNKTNVQLTTETVPNKTHSVLETTPVNLVTEENKTVQSNGDAAEVLVSSGSSKSTEKSSVESKKNKTKKKKDLNKKGESKEGGEMDAFLDKGEEVTSVASQVPAPPPVTSVSPVSEERIPSPVTIVDSEILSSIPLPEETSAVSTPQNDISPSEPTSETSSVSPSAESEDKENISEDAQSKIVLKYNYKEDQWSPLNPEGKKQYDRDFLLQLQSQPMSLCKPNNLPNLDVIKDKAHIQKLAEVNRAVPVSLPVRTYTDPFMPTYARGGAPRPPHPAVNRRSQPGRGEKPKKIISFSSSLTQNIKLHESENAWKPSHKVEKPADETAEIQDLYRKVRGILNKLTPQKFETLVGQVKTLSINTEEKLKGVIDLVFEKAIDEPNFSVPYANMCKQLALIKVPLAGQPGQQVNFRKLLLTKCQKEFEQDRTDELKRKDRIKAIESADPEKKKELQLEYDEEEKKMRYRQLGNIRFIGELFKLNMLIEPIMHECIKKLLSQQDEESLECLCRLLKTIGKELDEGKSNKAPRDTNLMDGYFAEMQRIVDKRLTSSRVRFMLQDVIDLKKNNWIPRRDENNPKTIDQIHKEAEREAREQQQVFSNMNYSKRMPDDRDRRKSAARNLGQSEEGWIPSSKSNKGSYNVVDPNKLKLTKPDEVESIRLGPGGRGLQSWGRGSSGGTKTSGDSDAKTPLANRYSALADQSLAPNYEARRGAQRSAASSRESSRGRNNPMTPPVRKTPSTSKERENLLETVKGLASRTGVSEPKAQDIKRNPESLLNGKAVDGPAVALRGVELSEDDVEKKTKPLINECLHNSDSEEATKCVTELASPTTDHYFIKSAVNQFLERSSQSRYFLGQLLCSLKKENIRISLEDYKKGFCGILENLDGYALDIPFIWEYIGEILVPMIEDNKLPLTFLKDILEPCMPSQKAGKLVSAVLHCAAKKKGTIKLGELWRECGLQWTDFLGSSANVDDFIRTYKLEFTIRPTKILPDTEMSSEGIKNLKILLEKTEESEEIFDRKNANVSRNALTKPSFIRALATAAHEDAITDYQKRSKGKKIPPSVKVNLSKQVIEKKTEPILDEFLYNGNFEEATKSVKELNSPSTIHYFISSAINQVLERSSQSRHLLGQLLCCLKRKNVITLHQYKKGFKYILENMDEYALDIPLVWKYVGEIVEPMIEDTKNPIIFLKYVLEPCMPSYAAGKIVSAILHIAAMEKGVIKMGKLWMESGMKWTDFLGFDVDVTSFIRTYKLEFTINPTEVLANTKVPQEDTRKNLPERTVESEDIFGSEDIAVLQDTQIKSPSIPTLDTAIHKSALTGVQSEDLKPCAVHLISSSVSRSQLPAEEILSSTKVITMTCTSDPYDQCTPGMEQKLNYGNESSLLSVVPADSLVDELQNNVETDVTKSASFGHTISSPVLPSQILTEKSSIQLDQSNSEGKQKQKEEIKSSLLSIDPVASIVDQPQNNVETDVTESTSFGLTVSSPVLPSQTPIGKTSGLGQSNSERKQRQKDEIKSSLLSVVSTDSVVMKVLDAAKVDLEECAVIQSCVADIVSAVVKLSQLPAEETLSSTKVITMTCTSDPYDQCTPGMEHKLNYGNESSLLSVVPADSLVDEPQNNVETDVTKSASFGHTVPSPVLPSQIPTEKSSIRLDQSNSEGKQKQKEQIKSSLLSIDPVASIVDKPQNNVETDVTESTSFGHTVSSPVLPSQTPIEKTSGLGQSNSERKQRQKDEIKSCLLSVVSTDSVVMKVLDADKVDLEECAVIQSCVANIVSAVVKLSLFPAEENRSNIETNTLQCISTSHNQSMPEEKQRPKDKIESSLLSIIPVNSVISDSHNSSPTKSTKPVGEQPCVTQTAFSQMPFLQSPAEEISSDIENNFRLCAPLVEKQKPKSICFYYSRDTIISHPHNSTETNLKVSTVVQPCVAHIMSVPPSQPSPGKIPSCIENDIMSCPAFRMPSSAPGMKKQKEGIESSFSEIPVDSVINKAHNSTEKGVVESAVV